MKVKLRRSWFYPIDAKPLNDKRDISGGRFRKGTHEMPEELREFLPKDAEVLDDAPVVVEPVAEATDYVELDVDRAAVEDEAAANEKAEEARVAAIQAKRVAALQKARAAKAKKVKEAK